MFLFMPREGMKISLEMHKLVTQCFKMHVTMLKLLRGIMHRPRFSDKTENISHENLS